MSETRENPFSDMDPALKEAVTRYGTPPVRQIVQVEVRDVGSYSFEWLPTTIDGWKEWLDEARAEAPAEYRDGLRCVLNYERGHYDEGDSADLKVWYERPETDAEMIKRVNRGISYVREREAQERRDYERLAAKFSPPTITREGGE